MSTSRIRWPLRAARRRLPVTRRCIGIQQRTNLFDQRVRIHVLLAIGQIEGIVECAEQIFQCQVRVGEPENVRGLTDYVQAPVFSTAVGLLQYGKLHQSKGSRDSNVKASVGGWFQRISNWLRGEF